MTNEDIERVARAICREAYLDDSSWPIFVLVARTAIAAMEPQWRPMGTAPPNRLIIVWAPGAEFDLPDIFALCKWHPDAGFCIDELRQPELWTEIPELPK